MLLNSIKWKSQRFDLQLPRGIDETILFCNYKEASEVAFGATWIFMIYSAYNGCLHSGCETRDSLCPRTICDFMRIQLNDLAGSSKSNVWLV